MNKVEIRDEIIEAVNYFELHRSVSQEELDLIIDKKLEQYADEVSRERAVKFAGMFSHKYYSDVMHLVESEYDEWIKKQEEQP